MRWLVSLLIIVVLAVALAMAGRYDPGYVVLVYPPWRAEISFISFVMILVVLVVSGVLLLRLGAVTRKLAGIVRAQRERRAAARRDENFVGGLRAYVECRYQDAEQALGQWQGDAPRLGLARVLAARAAQEMRALPQRERHLRDAAEHGSGLAAQLFEAEARLDAKDAVAALAAINRAKGIAPQHTALLRLELKARQMTGQWDEVERLLDALTRSNALESALNRSWHEDLVALYGEARGSNPVRQIEQAERWLHAHPRDAQLLLTLAQLCSAQQLWGKAQSYLEASLAIAASAEIG